MEELSVKVEFAWQNFKEYIEKIGKGVMIKSGKRLLEVGKERKSCHLRQTIQYQGMSQDSMNSTMP